MTTCHVLNQNSISGETVTSIQSMLFTFLLYQDLILFYSFASLQAITKFRFLLHPKYRDYLNYITACLISKNVAKFMIIIMICCPQNCEQYLITYYNFIICMTHNLLTELWQHFP